MPARQPGYAGSPEPRQPKHKLQQHEPHQSFPSQDSPYLTRWKHKQHPPVLPVRSKAPGMPPYPTHPYH